MDKQRTHNNAIVTATAILIMLAAVFLLIAFAPRQRISRTTGQISVAATIFPLYDIVRNVGGSAVSVQLILPANAEPHTFEPTPSTINLVQNSAVVYEIGHGLDSWVTPIAGRVPQVVVDRGIAIRTAPVSPTDVARALGTEPAQGDDPHYWLTVTNARLIAATVAADLSARFPAVKDEVARNLQDYDRQLADADARIKAALSGVKNHDIISLHDAWYYFSEAYGLKVVGTFEPTPGREPTPKYLEALKQAVDQYGIRTLYREPQFDSRPIETFAQDYGLRLVVLDDLGGPADRDTYVKLMEFNASAIAENQ